MVLKSGRIPLGFSPFVEHSFIDVTDLAQIARLVILDPKQHNLARYELVAQNISYHDIAKLVAKAATKDIQCEILSQKDFIKHMTGSPYVRNEHAEDSVMRMMVYYDRWGVAGNPNILRWLLGREPITWAEYTLREVRSIK